jgi:hypothetical protein
VLVDALPSGSRWACASERCEGVGTGVQLVRCSICGRWPACGAVVGTTGGAAPMARRHMGGTYSRLEPVSVFFFWKPLQKKPEV